MVFKQKYQELERKKETTFANGIPETWEINFDDNKVDKEILLNDKNLSLNLMLPEVFKKSQKNAKN